MLFHILVQNLVDLIFRLQIFDFLLLNRVHDEIREIDQFLEFWLPDIDLLLGLIVKGGLLSEFLRVFLDNF